MDLDGRRRQLIFDLSRGPSYDPDDFLVSASNETAFAAIEHWPDWLTRSLILLGPAGAGKSHLAAIWTRHADARLILTQSDLEACLAHGLTSVVVENADRRLYREADLFHLMNLVNERAGWLLVTARLSPAHWGVTTADLLSRLRLSSQVSIDVPDTALIRSVIVKLFADRQILISEDVVGYAALHCDRSLEAASRFVAAIDDEALSSGRRITRPLAALALSRLAAGDD